MSVRCTCLEGLWFRRQLLVFFTTQVRGPGSVGIAKVGIRAACGVDGRTMLVKSTERHTGIIHDLP